MIENGNRVTSFNGFTLTYDADGNLVHKVKPGVVDQTYIWNALGQLIRVNSATVTLNFTYDGFGRRIRQMGANGDTYYLYDGDNLIMELASNGSPIREYSYYPGVDRPHAVRRSSDGAVFYYLTEQPGTVTGLVNSSNGVANRYEYDVWGKLTYTSEQIAQPFRFAGREQDESGLIYMRARYYDPDLGRFISEDPIGLKGGINAYAYAGNDPLNRTDPYGLRACDVDQVEAGYHTEYFAESGNYWCVPNEELAAVVVNGNSPGGTSPNFGNPNARGGGVVQQGVAAQGGGASAATQKPSLPRVSQPRSCASQAASAAKTGAAMGAALGTLVGAIDGGLVGSGAGFTIGGVFGTVTGFTVGPIGAVAGAAVGTTAGTAAGTVVGAWIGAHVGFYAGGLFGATGAAFATYVACSVSR